MKWILIVDHHGDYSIEEFSNEQVLEGFMLRKKYYTIAYNSGFTRCAELNQKLDTVTFRDI